MRYWKHTVAGFGQKASVDVVADVFQGEWKVVGEVGGRIDHEIDHAVVVVGKQLLEGRLVFCVGLDVAEVRLLAGHVVQRDGIYIVAKIGEFWREILPHGASCS